MCLNGAGIPSAATDTGTLLTAGAMTEASVLSALQQISKSIDTNEC